MAWFCNLELSYGNKTIARNAVVAVAADTLHVAAVAGWQSLLGSMTQLVSERHAQ
jgi:hypothetical protein